MDQVASIRAILAVSPARRGRDGSVRVGPEPGMPWFEPLREAL